MGSNKSLEPVFTDVFSLVDYCVVYFDEHHYAARVFDKFDEDGGEFFVSKSAWSGFHSAMTDRERFWTHILEKSTEYYKQESLSVSDFRSEVLSYTSLQQTLDLELDQGLLPDIKDLRDLLEDYGLPEFRYKIHDLYIQANNQRRELEGVKTFEPYGRGDSRGDWLLSATISQYAEIEEQTESFMDYGFWLRDNVGDLMIGSECDAADHKGELAENIGDVSNKEPKILTPKQIFEKSAVFSE